jgi:cell wall-associated NlpC family hydrolase
LATLETTSTEYRQETPTRTRRARRIGATALLVPAILTGGAILAPPASAASNKDLDFSASKVVKVAKKYTGTAYRYGGTGPGGFDCSGFTKYVYGKFGIDLPHSARRQSRLGDRISKAKKKPGDIIVTAGGSHVGIYVGKGKFIDAPRPGQRVHIRKIYTSSYSVIRVDDDTRGT